jgi:hypothetical protein
VVAPVAGTYNCPQTVTITDQRADAAVYYTTDGSAPTTASQKYTAPFAISNTDTVRAVAIAPGSKASNPATVSYTCTSTRVAQSDFATSVQQRFNLPQPTHAVAFTDLHPGDPNYTAAQAIYPFLRRQLLCPGCLLTSNFSPDIALTRAQSAITFVSILSSQQKIQVLSQAQANTVLASVADAGSIPVLARPYIATAIQNGILPLQRGNAIQPMQPYSRADMEAAFNTIQTKFNVPPAPAQ